MSLARDRDAAMEAEIAKLARTIRKQYSFEPSEEGLRAWDVHRLIVLSRSLPIEEVALDSIHEYDSTYWYLDPAVEPTVRDLVEHMRLVNETDLTHPVLLAANGRVMDGMHRVAKAHLEGRATIAVRRFAVDPEPDYVGKRPDELPY